jgi:hypothetical protein
MRVVTEDEMRIDPLARVKDQQPFHPANERLRQNENDHRDAHQVEQIPIAVDEHVVDQVLDVHGGGETQDGMHGGA